MSIREFWRESDAGERIFIVGAPLIFLGFVIGWGYLLQLAAHLDALDRLGK